jgi:hypothetical protein
MNFDARGLKGKKKASLKGTTKPMNNCIDDLSEND